MTQDHHSISAQFGSVMVRSCPRLKLCVFKARTLLDSHSDQCSARPWVSFLLSPSLRTGWRSRFFSPERAVAASSISNRHAADRTDPYPSTCRRNHAPHERGPQEGSCRSFGNDRPKGNFRCLQNDRWICRCAKENRNQKSCRGLEERQPFRCEWEQSE